MSMTTAATSLTGAQWFKSSHSNDQGGNCVEGAHWFTSSYSNDHGGDCVEGARLETAAMAVRDSKDPAGPAFVFPSPAWTSFIAAVKAGELDGGVV